MMVKIGGDYFTEREKREVKLNGGITYFGTGFNYLQIFVSSVYF
jgi:hypothetical protein